MFCQKCDCENPDGAKFCCNCGTNIAAMEISSRLVSPGNPAKGSRPTFGQSISICLRKYADFNGRASRPEFWWFQLFFTLLGWGLLVLDNSAKLYLIFILGVWLPSCRHSEATTRRWSQRMVDAHSDHHNWSGSFLVLDGKQGWRSDGSIWRPRLTPRTMRLLRRHILRRHDGAEKLFPLRRRTTCASTS